MALKVSALLTGPNQLIDLRSCGVNTRSTAISVSKLAIHHNTGSAAILSVVISGSTARCGASKTGQIQGSGVDCTNGGKYVLMLPLGRDTCTVHYYENQPEIGAEFILDSNINITLNVNGVAYDYHEAVPIELHFKRDDFVPLSATPPQTAKASAISASATSIQESLSLEF